MTQDKSANDPLDFVRGMWNNMGFSLPGMVAPTLDIDELDKRITDMKAVENWLKMNTSMLQMTIQGLEMQRAALAAVKAMSQQRGQGDEPATGRRQGGGTGRQRSQPVRPGRDVAMELHGRPTGGRRR